MRSFAAKQPATRSPKATDWVRAAVGTSFLRSGGQPLPSEVRLAAQERFGHDFSRVRVHTEPSAAASARLLGARAYAVADRLVFDEGEYQPSSTAGRELLRHELTHVAQWKAGGSHSPAGTVPVAPPDTLSEREADRTATRPDLVSPVPAPLVQRKLSKPGRVDWGSYQIEMDKSAEGSGHNHVEITFTPDPKGPLPTRSSSSRSPSRRYRGRCGQRCTRTRRTSSSTRPRRILGRESKAATTWTSTPLASAHGSHQVIPPSRRTTRISRRRRSSPSRSHNPVDW